MSINKFRSIPRRFFLKYLALLGASFAALRPRAVFAQHSNMGAMWKKKPAFPSGQPSLWGTGNNNPNGQLGVNNAITNYSSPINVGSLTTWAKVTAGGNHTAAIQNDGSLWTWGLNSTGQLGLGTIKSVSSPAQVGTLSNWSKVSAKGNFTLAIKTDNTLWAWGMGTNGQLGVGNASLSSPVQLGSPGAWANISAGTNHSAGIASTGALWVWGLNTTGELGLGNITSYSSPQQVGSNTNWTSVATGSNFTCGISGTPGSLWAWGDNSFGQAGQNSITPSKISSPVQIGSGTTWYQVACGTSHVVAIKVDGSLWAWGNNAGGQLGQNDTASRSSPVQIGALSNWIKVYAGSAQSMAIKADGTVWAWGANAGGILGLGDINGRSSPTQVGSLTNWVEVGAGSNFTMYRRT